MLPLYVTTIFVSATLLFVVQPMVGKMVLPALGGTPAVWNTCMVFFQAILLVGYGYAHLSRKLGFRAQAVGHISLQLVALALLPIAVDTTSLADASNAPIGPLLLALVVSVGFPFFIISASAPLFQDWFGRTDHDDAGDPYHLYAASNAGSMLALLSYPVLIEPNFDVPSQAVLWRVGFGMLTLLTATAAFVAWRRRDPAIRNEKAAAFSTTWKTRAFWVFTAFVPSSLLLGATTSMTTDVAAVPLFWVVPLALYLATFILVFAKKRPISHELVMRVLPVVVAPFVVMLVMELIRPFWLVAGLHLLMFFTLAMYFHGELANARPRPAGLTEFYFWMSLGGVLGGAFNGLVAPLVFSDLWEYPLVVVVGVIFWSFRSRQSGEEVRTDMIVSLVLLALIGWVGIRTIPGSEDVAMAVLPLATVPVLARYWNPRYFGIGVAIAVLMGEIAFQYNYNAVYQERSFFAASRVMYSEEEQAKFLLHGTTSHGAQSLKKGYERWGLPYNPPGGPMEESFDAVVGVNGPDARAGVVGLGVGAHACFAREGQEVVFFEIDPVVEEIATNPAYFDFLERCDGRYSIIMGDGRIMMERQAPGSFDLIVLDGFTSDAIPAHLVTTEAIEIYLERLSERGLLSFHITNRHLDLEPMLAAQADKLGLVARVRHRPAPDIEEVSVGSTSVLVMGRSEEALGFIGESDDWRDARLKPGVGAWTDTFSNIFEVYRW